MKHMKSIHLLYIVSALKLLNTIIDLSFPTYRIGMIFYYGSITSFMTFFAYSYDPSWVLVSLVFILIVLVLWIAAIVTALLGIKYKRARNIFAHVLLLANGIDLFASTLIMTPAIQIPSIIVSALVFLLSAKVVWDIWRERKNKHTTAIGE